MNQKRKVRLFWAEGFGLDADDTRGVLLVVADMIGLVDETRAAVEPFEGGTPLPMGTKINLRHPLILLLVASVLACGDDPVEPEPEESVAASIEVVPDSALELRRRGDTIHLDAVVRDQDGEVMEEDPRWYTEQPEVVKVFALDGIVEARAGGEAWVYAGLGDLRDSVSVEVWRDFSGTYEGTLLIARAAGLGSFGCEAEAVVIFDVIAGDSIEGSFSTKEDYSGHHCNEESGHFERSFSTSGKFRGVRTGSEAFEVLEFFDLSEDGFGGHEDHVWDGEITGDTLRMERMVFNEDGKSDRARFSGVIR